MAGSSILGNGVGQQCLDYGQNFLSGQMTSLLSASGIELAGGTLSDISTEIQNKAFAAAEEAKGMALTTVSNVSGAIGSSIGTVAGAGLAAIQGATQSVDMAKQMALDVISYGLEQINGITSHIAGLASSFPAKVASKATELAVSDCKDELQEALKKITSNQEDINEKSDEKKKENKTKNIVKTITKTVGDVNKKINEYTADLEKDAGELGNLMLQGPTWVNSKLETAQTEAEKKIGKFIGDTKEQIGKKYDDAVDATAKMVAKKLIEKTVRPSITKAQDALNKLNENKSKVTQKAKTSAQKALFKLAGQLGISPL